MLKRDLRCLEQFLCRERLPMLLGSFVFLFIVCASCAHSDVVALYVNNEEIIECVDISNDVTMKSITVECESNSDVYAEIVKNNIETVSCGINEEALIERDNARIAEEERIAEEKRLAEEARLRQLAIDEAWYNEVDYCNNAVANVHNEISECRSNTKTYMAYTAVTSRNSRQYKLLNSPECYTNEYGLRMIGERYCIALGTGYCREIGTKVDLVLEDGSIVKCILGDVKSDAHTDEATHTYHVGGYEDGVLYAGDGSVAEFIVDNAVYNSARGNNSGSVSWIDGLDGKIIKVVVLPSDMTLAEDL